jgi:hypothetical protein
MKKYILPIATVSLFLAGCSAAYKTGQTPDDVYFSSNPKVASDLVRTERRTQTKGGDDYQSYFGAQQQDDNYLRMKVQNGGRWNSIDDYDYWYGASSYNPFLRPGYSSYLGYGGYNPYLGFGGYSPYSSFGVSYGAFYNPYSTFYSPGYYSYYPVIVNKRPTYSSNGYRPSLSGYGNNTYDRGYGNNRNGRTSNDPYRSYNNGSNNYDRPARTFAPSTNTGGNSAPASSGSSRSTGSSSGGGRGGRGG